MAAGDHPADATPTSSGTSSSGTSSSSSALDPSSTPSGSDRGATPLARSGQRLAVPAPTPDPDRRQLGWPRHFWWYVARAGGLVAWGLVRRVVHLGPAARAAHVRPAAVAGVDALGPPLPERAGDRVRRRARASRSSPTASSHFSRRRRARADGRRRGTRSRSPGASSACTCSSRSRSPRWLRAPAVAQASGAASTCSATCSSALVTVHLLTAGTDANDLLPTTSPVLIGVATVFGAAMLLTWRTAPQGPAGAQRPRIWLPAGNLAG